MAVATVDVARCTSCSPAASTRQRGLPRRQRRLRRRFPTSAPRAEPPGRTPTVGPTRRTRRSTTPRETVECRRSSPPAPWARLTPPSQTRRSHPAVSSGGGPSGPPTRDGPPPTRPTAEDHHQRIAQYRQQSPGSCGIHLPGTPSRRNQAPPPPSTTPRRFGVLVSDEAKTSSNGTRGTGARHPQGIPRDPDAGYVPRDCRRHLLSGGEPASTTSTSRAPSGDERESGSSPSTPHRRWGKHPGHRPGHEEAHQDVVYSRHHSDHCGAMSITPTRRRVTPTVRPRSGLRVADPHRPLLSHVFDDSLTIDAGENDSLGVLPGTEPQRGQQLHLCAWAEGAHARRRDIPRVRCRFEPRPVRRVRPRLHHREREGARLRLRPLGQRARDPHRLQAGRPGAAGVPGRPCGRSPKQR